MRIVFNRSFTSEHQLQFLVDFGQWLGDGQAPNKALSGMELMAKERKAQIEIKIIAKLKNALAEGKPIAFGMRQDFDRELQLVVDVGQQAGCLSALIASYQSFQQQRRKLLKRCVQGLVYPCSLLIAALVAVAFIGAIIIPRFSDIDDDIALPIASELLNTSGVLVFQLGPIILFSISLLIVFLGVVITRWQGSQRRHFENLAVFSVFRAYNAIYLLQGLSLLLASNLSVEQALRIFETNSSLYLKKHIQTMRQRLSRGETQLHKVFATGLLTPVALYRFQLGEAVQQSKGRLFAELAERMTADTERLIVSRQKALVYCSFLSAIALIVLIIVGLGQLFAHLAAQWA